VSDSGVEFELVQAPDEDEPSPSPGRPEPPEPEEDPAPDALPDAGGVEQLEPAEVEPFDEDAFPLAGPILESSRERELTGRCSSCERRLRIRVDGPGAVRVRCPICGHTRRIEV
jgi:predicted RNA-binding Zn-ribbon protein involved in translation (DUF1610 family)